MSEVIQQILDHPERFDAGDAWPCQIQTLIRIAQEQRQLRISRPVRHTVLVARTA